MAKTNHLKINNVFWTPWTKEGSNLLGFANVEFEFNAAPGSVISMTGLEVKTVKKKTGEDWTSAFFPQKKVGDKYRDVFSLNGEARWELVDAIMAKVNGTSSESSEDGEEPSKVNTSKATAAAKKKTGWGRD